MPQATQNNAIDEILNFTQSTGAASYLSPILDVTSYRLLKLELLNLNLVGGTSPTLQVLLEDMWNKGAVGGNYIGLSGLVAGNTINNSACLIVGENLPVQPVSFYLDQAQGKLAYWRGTHVQVQVNPQGSPTTATFQVRLLGFR